MTAQATSPGLLAHLAGAASQQRADQERHLRRQPLLGADLDSARRTTQGPGGRQLPLAAVHEWWHIRQRRSLIIGGRLAEQPGWD
jgi:hypothetical protein